MIHALTENATKRMDAELKAKWVAALRSGSYAQARETLRGSGGFCCLGVLLDLSGIGKWNDSEYDYVGDDGDYGSVEGDLCSLRRKFRIDSEKETTLIRMNDGTKEFQGKGKSFAEIADWIEANL